AIRTLESKKLPIIVGGTGLYINGLVMGINAVPDIDPEIKKEAQNLMESSSKEEFHRMLSDLDSAAASHIKAGDKQRMIRAYEVFRGTGKSILYFNSLPTKSPLDDYNISVFMLSPDRELLYKNCNDRFLKLLEIGALDEVRSNLEKQSPALGFMELKSYLNSEVTLDEAINLAQTKTRRYAKRQVTWFTHQLQNKKTLSFSSIDQYYNILENITKWVDL
ncbi:MAG: tRNA (adenosine(37)-N6)-dimethylallyltransferase MiaA, partial [Rickettsiaceae bacterium]|nr:tRNA (adenosine(37)-N6)-dimethylallyltransferase MiaA [Rickettsiaceae bacterium]